MGFVVAACSHNWTTACDAIQAKLDLVSPYLYVVLAFVILTLAVYSIISERKA